MTAMTNYLWRLLAEMSDDSDAFDIALCKFEVNNPLPDGVTHSDLIHFYRLHMKELTDCNKRCQADFASVVAKCLAADKGGK